MTTNCDIMRVQVLTCWSRVILMMIDVVIHGQGRVTWRTPWFLLKTFFCQPFCTMAQEAHRLVQFYFSQSSFIFHSPVLFFHVQFYFFTVQFYFFTVQFYFFTSSFIFSQSSFTFSQSSFIFSQSSFNFNLVTISLPTNTYASSRLTAILEWLEWFSERTGTSFQNGKARG